jgi:hypothetical protein
MHTAPGDDSTDGPVTLLIASEGVLNAWGAHAECAPRVLTVLADDLSSAVEAIRTQQPAEIIVEQAFAASGRGAPLMTLLYDQRRLRGTQIRLLAPEQVRAIFSSQPDHTSSQAWLTALGYPLPPRPPQRAPRMRVPAGHRILIDGRLELLVDVSRLGAQIRGSLVLHPGQHVNLVLQPLDNKLKVAGVVVWSMFELSPAPCYRAGIAFSTAIQEGLDDLLNGPRITSRRVVEQSELIRQETAGRTEVCGVCRSTRPASRMATLMGRRLCFDCAAECYDESPN